MKNRKRILQWGRILLVLIWVLAGAFLVVHASMHAFQHQLYFRSILCLPGLRAGSSRCSRGRHCSYSPSCSR